MGKFLVTSGSHFEPFTYDELAKPIVQTVEAHNAAQEQYDTLGAETAALEQYLMREPEDSVARSLYDSYIQKLQALQDNLWRNGFSASTKRDLAAARMGYYRDINRIGNAVKTRQDRSKEFWTAKHNNPDLITSRDPASYSLDDYLADDTFGQNWFSYSGKEFEAGVGAEVKARASEMIRSHITSDPELVGTLTRVRDNGFTNAETIAAGELTRQLIDVPESERMKYYVRNQVSDPIIILTESIISRYDATGARNADLDPTERARFIDYGTRGTAQGVLGKEYKDFDDKVFDQQQKMQLAAYNNSLQKSLAAYNNELAKDLAAYKAGLAGKNGSGGGDNYQPRIMGETLSMKSAGYDDWVKSTEKESKYYRDGQVNKAVPVVVPDGRGGNAMKEANNEYEMAQILYGTKGRETVRRTLGGYDIALDPNDNKDVTVKYKDGTTATYKARRPTQEEATLYGIDQKTGVVFKDVRTGKINPDLSRDVSDESAVLHRHIDQLKTLNPDIEKMAVSPKKQRDLRAKNEYPASAPWDDFYNYMASKETIGDFSPVVLVGNDTAHDYVRENLANELIGQFGKESDEKGNVSKGSRYAIRVVNDGHMSMREEPITNLGDVLGRNKDGSIRNDTIVDVYSTIDDYTGRRYIRFGSTVHPGVQFAVDPIAFGPLVQNSYDDVSPLAQRVMSGLDPKNAISMSQKEAEKWAYDSFKILGSDPNNMPLVMDNDGKLVDQNGQRWRPVYPLEVMRNPRLKEKIRQSVKSELLNPSMGSIREAIAINHEQHVGDTNANAEGYF